MVSALGEHTVSQYVLVRVTTDAGVVGAGEATGTPRWSGETVWGMQAVIEQVFTPLLLGCDPNELDEIEHRMDQAAVGNWFAKSALEMACWDILGKDAGRPVYELLGGAVRPLALRCRFSMGAYPLDRARRRAEELMGEGFRTIKVKVGTQIDEDVARVRAVREVIGPDAGLVIDANAGWDAATAIAAAQRLEDCDVGVFEQPTTNGDYAALAEVRRAVRPKILADDIVFDHVHARECLRNETCDAISVYPGKNGGIGKAKAIVELAERYGVACTIGSNLELDVGTAAMCHLAVACPNVRLEEYPGDILGPDYHETRIAKDPISIDGPVVTITARPGLGVEVDWDLVGRLGIRR